MKKTLILIAAAAFAAASCTEEINPESNPAAPGAQDLKSVTFEVTGSTRTVGDGSAIVWSAGDSVAVFDGVAETPFVFKTTEGGATARFNGEVSATATDLVVIYPFGSAVSATEVVIPTLQRADQSGSFGKECNVSVGKTTVSGDVVTSVTLRNVCSWAKVTISREDVASVLFTGTDDEIISGPVTLSFDGEGVPTASAKDLESGSGETFFPNQVTLLPATDKSAAIVPGTYYIAVKPASLAGVRLFFSNTAAQGELIYSTQALTFERSKFRDLGTVDASQSFAWREVTTVKASFIKAAALYKTAAEVGTKNRGAIWPFAETQGTSGTPAKLKTLTLNGGEYQFVIDSTRYDTKGGIWTNSNQGFVLGYPKAGFYLQTPAVSGSKLISVSYSGYQDSPGRCYNPTIRDVDSTAVLGGGKKDNLPGFTLGTWNLSGTVAGAPYRLYVQSSGSKFLDQLNLTYLADAASTQLVLNTTEMVDGFEDFPSCKEYSYTEVTDESKSGTYTFTQGGTDYSFYFYGLRVGYSSNKYSLYYGSGGSHTILLGKGGSYIQFPAVEGKKLVSVTIINSATSDKEYKIYDSAEKTTLLGQGSASGKITASSTETIELSGSVAGTGCCLFASSSSKFIITSLVYE